VFTAGSKSHVVDIDPVHFEEGGCRYAFKGRYVDAGATFPVVVKFWKHAHQKGGTSVWFKPDMKVYRDAADLATAFERYAANKFSDAITDKKLKVSVSYVTPNIGKVTKVGQLYAFGFIPLGPVTPILHQDRSVFIEPYLEGKFDKFNSNNGFPAVECMISETFSHWSFAKSDARHLVCDVQGVKVSAETHRTLKLTDPCIHSLSALQYGNTDFGMYGQVMWFSRHKCNPVCKGLLRPPSIQDCASAMGITPQEFERRSGLGVSQPGSSRCLGNIDISASELLPHYQKLLNIQRRKVTQRP